MRTGAIITDAPNNDDHSRCESQSTPRQSSAKPARTCEFVETLLRRIADADVRFERGVPVFPRRPGAPILKVEDVDQLVDGPDA